MTSLIERLHSRRTHKEIIAYPNSGAAYCSESKTWKDAPEGGRLAESAPTWLASGARLIGGCCRVTAADLSQIAATLPAS